MRCISVAPSCSGVVPYGKKLCGWHLENGYMPLFSYLSPLKKPVRRDSTLYAPPLAPPLALGHLRLVVLKIVRARLNGLKSLLEKCYLC